jgi:DNA-binding transcriptional ArsR family regulator
MNCSRTCGDFVESMGLFWESEGLPRIAGRLFGFLIVQSEPCSLDDLAAALGVSKASISTDSRRLEQLGLITRVGKPGDRRDYYVVDPNAPITSLELRLRGLRRAERSLDLLDLSSLPPVVQQRIQRFEHAHDRIVRALEDVLEQIRSEKFPPAPLSETL